MSLALMDGFDVVDTPLYRWTQLTTTAITMLPAASTRLLTGQAVHLEHTTILGGLHHAVPGGTATLIAGFAARFSAGATTNSAGITFLGDTGATAHTSVRFDVGAGTITALRGATNTANILGSASAGVNLSLWNYYEVRCLLSDTVGQVEVRVNGSATPVLNLTAVDTKNAGTGAIYDAIRLITTLSGSGSDWDDVVVLTTAGSAPLNTFLGDVSIKALLPNGPGAVTMLTSSTADPNWQNVNDLLTGMADYNYSPTDNQQDTYTMADLTGSGTVLAVQAHLFASKSDAGAKSLAPIMRIGGTDYAGSDQALGTTAGILSQLYETSPAGGAWSVATVNSMETGVRIRP